MPLRGARRVSNAGAGHPADCPEEATIIGDDITLDTVWEDTEGCDFLVSSVVEVQGDLAIEPGVLVAFEDGAALVVTGSLNAVGADRAEIRMVGAEAVPGWWEGIVFASDSDDNRLSRVVVADAGRGEDAEVTDERATDVLVRSGARVQISDSEISRSAG